MDTVDCISSLRVVVAEVQDNAFRRIKGERVVLRPQVDVVNVKLQISVVK